jgi:TonB family protein
MRQWKFETAVLTLAILSVTARAADTPIWQIHQAPDRDGIYYTGPEVSLPVLEKTFSVPYPSGVPAKQLEGMTVLAMVIDASGKPDHIQLLHSNGDFCDQASMTVVKRSVFSPAKLGEKPVPVWIDVRVVFHANMSEAVPQILIAERDLPAPPESAFEDKHGKPLPYTEPIPIHVVDADFANPFIQHPMVEVVRVNVLVGVDGLPKSVRVIRGIGFGADEKAVAAVMHYKFLPATKKGIPVEASRDLFVDFSRL